MNKMKWFVLPLACVALSSGLFFTVFAQDTATTSGGSSLQGFSMSSPQGFNSNANQAFPNVDTCKSLRQSAQFEAAAGALASAMKGGADAAIGVVGRGVACPAPGKVITDISCDRLSSLDGYKAENDATLAAYTCQSGLLGSVSTEVSCLNQQAGQLALWISSLEKEYTTSIQNMQQYVGKVVEYKDNRQAQLDDVGKKLGKDDKTGTPGLLALQDMARKLVDKMPVEIEAADTNFKEVDTQKKSLDEAIKTRTAALAGECFTQRTSPNFKCSPKQPPTSAANYALCRYEQMNRVDKNGNVMQGAAAQELAKRKKDELQSVLSKIVGDWAKESQIPQGEGKEDANKRSQYASQGVLVSSYDDFVKSYGKQLDGFGTIIASFIRTSMQSCFVRGRTVVDKERTWETSDIGKIQRKIKELERKSTMFTSGLFTRYGEAYADVMRGLTGQHLPLNLDACRGNKPDAQMACLKDIQVNMQGLLSGTLPQSQVQIQIRGTAQEIVFPGNNVQYKVPVSIPPIVCNGLNGCITKLQNLSRDLTSDITATDTKLKKDVLTFNQQVERYTKERATQLAPFSQSLRDYAQKINAIMASLGVSGAINMKSIKAEKLQKNKEMTGKDAPFAVYDVPTSILNLIGGQMSPPMLDIVDGDIFSDAMGKIGQKQSDVQSKVAEVSGANSALEASAQACRDEAAKAEKDEERSQKMEDYITSGGASAAGGTGSTETTGEQSSTASTGGDTTSSEPSNTVNPNCENSTSSDASPLDSTSDVATLKEDIKKVLEDQGYTDLAKQLDDPNVKTKEDVMRICAQAFPPVSSDGTTGGATEPSGTGASSAE